METWLVALIVLIIIHYFLAVLSVFFVLRDHMVPGIRIRTGILVLWNVICLFVPVVGPCVYLIARNPLKKKREKWASEHPLPRKTAEQTADPPAEEPPAEEKRRDDITAEPQDESSGTNTVNQ